MAESEKGDGGISLPKAGLAEDILKQVEGQHTGPEQLFSFADSLHRGESSEARRQEEQLETWVFFNLGPECYGLPVSHVQEILRVTGITKVPHAPDVVRGVTNMRGKVLPVVDLKLRLGLAGIELGEHSRILVVSMRGRMLGLLVDSVQQVARIAKSNIQPPPPDVMTAQSDYILGVYYLDELMVIMLEVEKVLLIKDRK